MKGYLAIFLTLLASKAYALPFQEPIPGTYQCFSSQESPFEENVEDIGATLEFPNAQTYRLTTASATEEGTVSSSAIDTSSDAEIEAAMTALWQGGSNLVLQPSSGSVPYEGGFFVDHLGSSYAVIQNNNGLHIRCESEGADIAATFDRAANGEAMTTPVNNERIPQLTPLNSVVEGKYQCQQSMDNYETDGTHNPEAFYDIFAIELFATNEYVCNPIVDSASYNCLDNGAENTFQLNNDGTLTWLGGDMANWFGDWSYRYGQDINGTPTLLGSDEEEDSFTGNTLYNIHQCPRIGEASSLPASAENSQDFQLAPLDIKAPLPPAGAGGLSGLYINYDDSLDLSYQTTMDINGNIIYTPNVSYSAPAFIYFLENGYVYEGLYPWSFAELDCSRMKADNTPLCNTYILQNGTIQFGNDEPQPFLQGENNTIRIGENVSDFWTKQEPLAIDTRLEGIWEYVNAGSFGGTGVDTLILRQDGTFEWRYSGTVSYDIPDSVSDATGVDVYVGGTSTKAKIGTYRIDGYTLELNRDDGVAEKVLFVLDTNDDGLLGNIWLGGAVRYLNVNQ
jgi:hypothetical protein